MTSSEKEGGKGMEPWEAWCGGQCIQLSSDGRGQRRESLRPPVGSHEHYNDPGEASGKMSSVAGGWGDSPADVCSFPAFPQASPNIIFGVCISHRACVSEKHPTFTSPVLLTPWLGESVSLSAGLSF